MPRYPFLALATMAIALTACATAGPSTVEPAVENFSKVAPSAADRASTPGEANAGTSSAQVNLPGIDRMIIATVQLTVSVENAMDASRLTEQIAARYGGFVASSNVRDQEESRAATVTLRVPAENLNGLLADLRAIGPKVSDESRTTQDVTEEYADVESNLRNLRATETQLLSLMERASGVQEVLAVQRELTNNRGQIERLEGRRRMLENRVDLATVDVKLLEAVAEAPRDGWRPLEALEDALQALSHVGQWIATAAIWALVFLPVYGIPLAWLLVRGRFLRRAVSGSP